MKEPLRMPLEATGPDLVGPRLVHETGGDDRQVLPGFCAELREARLRGGYSLSDAAHVLRIQEHYLEALEEGRFDQIPGTTYIIGFLRSYSGFLGLDPDEIIDAFKREQGLGTKEPRLAFPSPSDSSPKPKFWLILLVLVLAGLAYGGWQYQSTGGQIATDLVDDVSTKLTEAVGLSETDATGAAATGGDAAPETAAAQPAAEATPEPPAETATAPVVAEVTTAAPSEPDPSASGQVEPAPAAPRQEEPARAEPAAADIASAPTAQAETVRAADVAAPSAPNEPSVASAEISDPSPAIAVPLDFVVAEVGGTDSTISSADEAVAGNATQSSGTTDSVDVARADAAGIDAAATVDDAASAPAATEPMADVPPEETAPPSTTTEEPSLPSADAGYVPKVYGRTNLDSRVVITAVDDSWVQVQGPDNELLLTRILHAGDSYRVPDRPGLVMVTGNAGGLEVKVDDAVAPALGPLGVVMRNIALDPDRLLSGTATGG
jgi:cytoskeleton protein RodZ